MARERKKQYEVEIPFVNQRFKVLSSNPEKLLGKIIKLDLTRMLRGRNIEANIEISKDKEGLVGHFLSLKVLHSYIKRMMRKNISWIEDSFVISSKDNSLRIKPFMITKKSVHRSVRTALRNEAKIFIEKFVADRKAEDIFEAAIRGSLQKDLIRVLKKIYPLAFCEIRVLKIEKLKQKV